MTYLFPVAFIDPPLVLAASVTNIPGSGSLPLQVIANVGPKYGVAIDFIDTTGDYIGVYQGASGHETLVCIIGNGLVSRAFGVITAYQRVSIRSMAAAPITNGNLTFTVMGY
jgi:hypothetical protein